MGWHFSCEGMWDVSVSEGWAEMWQVQTDKNQILSQDQLLCSVAGNLIGTCTCTWCLSHLSARTRHRWWCQKTNDSLAHHCCVWQLVCISALWKGRQHRAKWNYIVVSGHTHRNTTHLSHVLSYFPSCNPTLRMQHYQTSTCKDVIFHVEKRACEIFRIPCHHWRPPLDTFNDPWTLSLICPKQHVTWPRSAQSHFIFS